MAPQENTSVTSLWMDRHSDLYRSAIRAPFILAIRAGSLDFRAYTRWLEQDYLYVKSFVRFLASVLAKAPDSASDEEVDVLLGGLNAIQDELRWFRSQASKWDLRLHQTAIHETTHRYCKFLSQLSEIQVEYPVALSALWSIEAVYNHSFSTCLEEDAKTAPEFQEACRRWGNAEFEGYCNSLKGLADKALQEDSPAARETAESYFEQVLRLEIDFWSMSFERE